MTTKLEFEATITKAVPVIAKEYGYGDSGRGELQLTLSLKVSARAGDLPGPADGVLRQLRVVLPLLRLPVIVRQQPLLERHQRHHHGCRSCCTARAVSTAVRSTTTTSRKGARRFRDAGEGCPCENGTQGW